MNPILVNLPLLGGLLPDGVKPGTIFVAEFDPESHWFALAVTITAAYVKKGSHAAYLAMARPREEIIADLANLGVAVSSNPAGLAVDDWYSASLTGGRLESANQHSGSLFEPIEGGSRVHSLRVADLSLQWLKEDKGEVSSDVIGEDPPGTLIVAESISQVLRFNDERAYLEWVENRLDPGLRRSKYISLQGIVRGIHSEAFYKRMENASDGVIEVRVLERDEEAKNLLRIRGFKGKRYDARWHEIEIKPNGEAVLAT